jgi:4-amino-4-deoxy-L-arabinose transferase-like glycosyltransferase
MFNDILGSQISWLLPAAAILFVAALVLRGRAPRTDQARAALLLWGLWLGVHFAVFSFQSGVIHPYYTTAMAPAIGALVGGGGVTVWKAIRTSDWAWLVLPITTAITAYWSVTLLDRNSYATWLVPVIIVAAVVAIAALMLMKLRPAQRIRLGGLGLAALVLVGLAGPTAFAASAASSTTNGVNPLAGPSSGSLGGAPGGAAGGGPGQFPGSTSGRPSGQSGEPPEGMPGGAGGPGGGRGFGGPPSGTGGQSSQSGGLPGGFPGGTGRDTLPGRGAGAGSAGGGIGGDVSSAMIAYLEKNQGGAKWLLAVSDSNTAAQVMLQTNQAVISMYGFTGSDPAMTVAKMEQLVASGELKYVMLGGGMGGGGAGAGGTSSSTSVDSWVQANCTAVSASEYGGTTTSTTSASTSTSGLYECIAKTSGTSS